MMLQRAASNAYSWWWASHIRTKQSKWLDQNLQDIEERVQHALKLLEDEGDSFAKRAEMYYKRRPELINFVEEIYRAYRALAERYDHISTELQNANTTIASVFPDHAAPFSIDEDDDDDDNGIPNTPKFAKKPPQNGSNIPSVPKVPVKELKGWMKKFQPNKAEKARKDHPTAEKNSGLNRHEAVREIDTLQKEILSLQTEKEFVRDSYESGLAKYWDIENQIKEKQGRICNLRDEFDMAIVIEDGEAQRLMAETAIKSCGEKLAELEERHERAVDEAKIERERIDASGEKLRFLAKEETLKAEEETEGLLNNGLNDDKHKREPESVQVNENNISLTIAELAEKIEELVNTVISLETMVSSQTALIQRLRAEIDDLLARICNLENKAVTPVEDKSELGNSVTEIKEKLRAIQNLYQNVEDHSDDLRAHFRDARRNLDWLSEKLKNVKPDKELEADSSNVPTEEHTNDADSHKESGDEHSKDVKKTDQEQFHKEMENENAMKDEKVQSPCQNLIDVQQGFENTDSERLRGSDNQNEQNTNASPSEEQFKMRIDSILEKNLDFWLRFSASIGKIQKFNTGIKDLKDEISLIEEKKKQDGSNTLKYILKSDVRPIYRHLKEINTELTVWLEKSTLFKDELSSRSSSLSEIENEVKKALDESKLTNVEAAELQGEVTNMKRETKKVSDELQVSSDHVTELQSEVEKILADLNEEFSISSSKNSRTSAQLQHSESRSRVPLSSFLFGTKPKTQKQSIFSCVHPSLYRKFRTNS